MARPKPAPVPAIMATMLVTILAIPLLSTCNFPLTFGDEYRDSSVNFIEARVLAVPPDAMDVSSLDALGVWDWGWRAQTGNTYQYMNAIELAPGTGPGGIGTAWLLEAVNLADNPAFVGGATTGWGASGGATLSGAGGIHGSALFAESINIDQFVYIDRDLFIDDLGALGHTYFLSLNATGILGIKSLEVESLADYAIFKNQLATTGWVGTGPYYQSISNIKTGSTQILAFNNTDATFQFDDISAIRTDVLPRKWSLVLRLGRSDTEPALVPGIYEFSVYVRRPPTHTFSTDPGRGDSENYAARHVTLRATQTAAVGIAQPGEMIGQTVAEQSFDISALPDTWNRLVLRMPSGSNFSFSESTTGGVIELSISPMNPSNPEAGAVLIADPSLHFFIDGY